MEWWAVLSFFILGLIILLATGFPIAFGFLMIDILGILIFMGPMGLHQVTLQIFSSLSTFTLTPIPLFILMGELMFHSGIANNTIDVIDKWLGRLPGRLSLLAAGAGVLFAALSGSTLANTAMLGTVLLPEMRRRGYKTSMAVGPIIGVGGLAMLIPPSSLAVVLASIGHISVGKILVGGVIPGLLLGGLIASYIIIRCWLNPSLAPRYDVEAASFFEKVAATVKYVIPLGFIIFMVLGLMLLGVATPTEAAASGALATILVTLVYGRLTWRMLKASIMGTLEISVMVFMIIAASNSFSSILAYTGATQGLLGLVEGLHVPPLVILIGMQVIIFVMGTFMETISIMMICMPIFMPIVKMLGFDPVWFGVLMLINFETGFITPPFGMLLFVMKGVAPADINIKEICYAAVPFILCEIAAMTMIIAWPDLVLWLPGLLGR
ncbi:MAG: TRAP transporter large permease [Deltaproteobacteria bacterium]|nr:TRAP transporter large permease [Deltaproteobacteria bacterium]MBW2018104.1 TRAP transporter large permease [Deltaproteobacteria bacterium]MBW2129346.1 TRAP transporter large permease [Deltaproteobacteria bacterium]MBW2302327.1 TRAP transporter large permease [Deltaproteobacteria bacterium]